jgi:hypothetical protein
MRPTIKIYIYLEVHFFHLSSILASKMMSGQADRSPVEWNGFLSTFGFQFWLDDHLSHLANIALVPYEVYRVYEQPHWQLAEPYGSEYVESGEFLVYKPLGLPDDECPGIENLVRSLHESMTEADPDRDFLPVPSRYLD